MAKNGSQALMVTVSKALQTSGSSALEYFDALSDGKLSVHDAAMQFSNAEMARDSIELIRGASFELVVESIERQMLDSGAESTHGAVGRAIEYVESVTGKTYAQSTYTSTRSTYRRYSPYLAQMRDSGRLPLDWYIKSAQSIKKLDAAGVQFDSVLTVFRAAQTERELGSPLFSNSIYFLRCLDWLVTNPQDDYSQTFNSFAAYCKAQVTAQAEESARRYEREQSLKSQAESAKTQASALRAEKSKVASTINAEVKAKVSQIQAEADKIATDLLRQGATPKEAASAKREALAQHAEEIAQAKARAKAEIERKQKELSDKIEAEELARQTAKDELDALKHRPKPVTRTNLTEAQFIKAVLPSTLLQAALVGFLESINPDEFWTELATMIADGLFNHLVPEAEVEEAEVEETEVEDTEVEDTEDDDETEHYEDEDDEQELGW